ncbi:putative methyltransferase-domain-containing protein [Tribonema minus]|uniref:Putative methyltransferase-domain-containing protein n=1 Tax=Tribonema minus TaxID=303371 RepID=A0A836CF84_9STRA|nr:putative methyltransferase-domain-containing protein [Tribonema minus]
MYAELGFMFDTGLPRTQRTFTFGPISTTLQFVDDEPGAVQSGHYLWPASPCLASYLVEQRESIPAGSVLELGAGCGLAGLTAAQLTGVSAVVFTDHDFGVIELLQENIEHLRQAGSAKAGVLAAQSLSWGEVDQKTVAAVHAAAGLQQPQAGAFSLVLGSDVIYAKSVVRPLFATACAFLAQPHGQFIMSQSFAYDAETEAEMDAACAAHKLRRRVVHDALGTEGGTKLQIFTWASSCCRVCVCVCVVVSVCVIVRTCCTCHH